MPNDDNYHNTTQSQSENIPKIIALSIILILLCLVTIFGNLIVLISIATQKRLQTVGNLFIVSLASADMIVGTFVMPLAALYLILGEWVLGKLMCNLWLSIDYTASTASIFALLLLCIDRYTTINYPLKSLSNRTNKRALIMISITWLISSLWVLPINLWNISTIPMDEKRMNNSLNKTMKRQCSAPYDNNALFKLLTAVGNFFVPLITMIGLYGKIYCIIYNRSKVLRSNDFTNNDKNLSVVRSLTGKYENILQKTRRKTSDTKKPLVRRLTFQACSRATIIRSDYSTSNDFSKVEINGKSKRCEELTVREWKQLSIELRKKVLLRMIVEETRQQNERNYKKKLWKHFKNRLSFNSFNNSKKYSASLETSRRTFSNSSILMLLPKSSGNRLFSHKLSPSIPNSFNYPNIAQKTLSYPNLSIQDTVIPKAKRKPTMRQISLFTEMDEGKSVKRGFHSKLRKSFETKSTGNLLQLNTSSMHLISPDVKAARQLGLILFVFTVCWLPYFILFMIVAMIPDHSSSLTSALSITVWFGYLNSTFNCFLYPLSNKQFHIAFLQLFSIKPQRK
ncbi:hypothetical protein SNEBB_004932 [Seison nebaliae]|nr:hypothetical protein SNEBB_004932 [Seison nebaliae]